MTNRRPGRPRKKKDTIELWRFVRSAMAVCGYDQARETDQKHGVAVTQAVAFVKQLIPEMPISETEVKRTLAGNRPRNSQTILRFKRASLSQEELQTNRSIRMWLAGMKGKKGVKFPEVPNYDLAPNATTFKICVAARPHYPRFNRKPVNE